MYSVFFGKYENYLTSESRLIGQDLDGLAGLNAEREMRRCAGISDKVVIYVETERHHFMFNK